MTREGLVLLESYAREYETELIFFYSRLSDEIEHRKKVQLMLVSYLRSQKEKAEATQELLNQYKNRKEKLGLERKEVHKHYNNLPDLDKLPNTDQLPPLPSASALFNK